MPDAVEPHADKTLDTRGLLCPEPVMMLHSEINQMQNGEVVLVTATDPSTQRDIPKFCLFLQHALVHQEQDEREYRYWVKKNG